jgi:hypothetical protein
MSERFFTTSLPASIEKNFSYLAESPRMFVQKAVAHQYESVSESVTIFHLYSVERDEDPVLAIRSTNDAPHLGVSSGTSSISS